MNIHIPRYVGTLILQKNQSDLKIRDTKILNFPHYIFTAKCGKIKNFLTTQILRELNFSNFNTFSWGTNSLFRFICCCCKHDRYFGAIDDNKNLDIGIYIRNRRLAIRALKGARTIPQDFPSWPENVVLPYRPWDNENQVPIY